ncbi:MAG: 4-phosphopantetheinyl transferase family protein [Cyclobacteriaceae bacterium]
MIGIDVHDLRDQQSRTRSKQDLRFISHPLDSITGNLNENLTFWAYWTVKEAIFKAHRQLTTFDPKSIPVQIAWNNDRGSIIAPRFNGFVFVDDNRTIALVSSTSKQPAYKCSTTKGQAASTSVRQMILADHPAHSLIDDENGLPLLVTKDGAEILVSFSHHGRYMAYATAPKP